MARFLGFSGPHGGRIFDVFYLIVGFNGFESGSRPVDQVNHSQHPGDVFERLGDSSGAQS